MPGCVDRVFRIFFLTFPLNHISLRFLHGEEEKPRTELVASGCSGLLLQLDGLRKLKEETPSGQAVLLQILA